MAGKSSLGQKPKTEEINSGFNPVQNSYIGLKPVFFENPEYGRIFKTQLFLVLKGSKKNFGLFGAEKHHIYLVSNSKSEKLISNPDSSSGCKEDNRKLRDLK